MEKIVDRGKNLSLLQLTLLKEMDGDDASRLIARIKSLMTELPEPIQGEHRRQGLLLGLVQSGKTVALTTAIALAADNGYKCFIVLTSDNTWLYKQTIDRLKNYLQGLEIEGKQQWEGQMFMQANLKPGGDGLVLVATKNATVLKSLVRALDKLKTSLGNEWPVALIVDDEADQASLDTQASRRARDPSITPGPISNLINGIRGQFPSHTYLQVTATPQALFLQESDAPHRPEFTVLIEPGKGYIGGNTFFSIEWGTAQHLIRYIDQRELDNLLATKSKTAPESLKRAICLFFVAATVDYLRSKSDKTPNKGKYSFLCHISQRKTDHMVAEQAITAYHQSLKQGLSDTAKDPERTQAEGELKEAYSDLLKTLSDSHNAPTFDEVIQELRGFIVGTEVQVLNSDKEEDQPTYQRRYNILIGGNKLSRGVTIPNLLVTYYGRQAKSPNMDTVLQHARMYGYRAQHLDITRLFVTDDVERRFRLINESEQALRHVIEQYPGREYQGIRIGKGIKATRSNVLNPNNIGSYVAGSNYFPKKPIFEKDAIAQVTESLDQKIALLQPRGSSAPVKITIKQAIELIRAVKCDPTGSGLWDTEKIVSALATLGNDLRYSSTAYFVALYDRKLGPNKATREIRAVLAGASSKSPGDEEAYARKDYPTLFMYRIDGKKWDGQPFWIPNVRFPDGQYALLFNFD